MLLTKRVWFFIPRMLKTTKNSKKPGRKRTPAEDKKPAKNKQSDDDKKAQGFDRDLEPVRFLTPGFTVCFMSKLFIYTTLG